MILTCNSCSKQFVVPDNAITSAGRVVQCGSCGNKWKQFPISSSTKDTKIKNPQLIQKAPKRNIGNIKKTKKNTIKKSREISLYSPEYLAKKHGIKINDEQITSAKSSKKSKVSFGFYNYLLLFIVLVIFFSRILYFSQELVVAKFPALEFYLNYFFESMRNVFDIWKSLIASY